MKRLIALLLLIAATVIAQDPAPPKNSAPARDAAAEDPPAIRSFPIPTIVALGKELYRRDQLAAKAFDLLFARHPEAQQLPIRGWVTEIDKDHQRVFFIQEKDGQFLLAYIVAFSDSASPQIIDRHGAPLPDFVAIRYAARQAGIGSGAKLMTDRYNCEVLDDPEHKGGFLVYLLAATVDPKEVIVGGHYRVTIAPDGKTVQQVDALSRSLLVLRRDNKPKGHDLAFFSMSHIVSNTPVETHVFANLIGKVPFFIATMDDEVWMINEGDITKVDKSKLESAAKPSRPAK